MGKDDEIHGMQVCKCTQPFCAFKRTGYLIGEPCQGLFVVDQMRESDPFAGVEKFVTDTTNHKVVVTGRINPDKVLKKLRKKTRRRVEILPQEEIKNLENQETKEEPIIEDEFAVDTYHEYPQTPGLLRD